MIPDLGETILFLFRFAIFSVLTMIAGAIVLFATFTSFWSPWFFLAFPVALVLFLFAVWRIE